MENNALIKITSTLVSLAPFSGAGMLSAIANKVMEDRERQARETFITQFRSGVEDFGEADLDPLIAMYLRYQTAARQGAAKRNLELLAKVIAGQFSGKRPVYPDYVFSRAPVLETLSEEEIVILGVLVAETKKSRLHIREEFASNAEFLYSEEAWGNCRTRLSKMDMFKPYTIFQGFNSSLARTGLVCEFDSNAERRSWWRTTPAMDELNTYLKFEEQY